MINKKGTITIKSVLFALGGVCYAIAGGTAILQRLTLTSGFIILGSALIFIGQFF